MITVRVKVNAPISGVWMLWTTKSHIKAWNNATPDWYTPKVKIDLIEDGKFRYLMSAKDGSESFKFKGTFDIVDEPHRLAFTLSDGRKVDITFKSEGSRTAIVETFDAHPDQPIEVQKKGWQAILDNFKEYAEDLLDDDADSGSQKGSLGKFKDSEDYD